MSHNLLQPNLPKWRLWQIQPKTPRSSLTASINHEKEQRKNKDSLQLAIGIHFPKQGSAFQKVELQGCESFTFIRGWYHHQTFLKVPKMEAAHVRFFVTENPPTPKKQNAFSLVACFSNVWLFSTSSRAISQVWGASAGFCLYFLVHLSECQHLVNGHAISFHPRGRRINWHGSEVAKGLGVSIGPTTLTGMANQETCTQNNRVQSHYSSVGDSRSTRIRWDLKWNLRWDLRWNLRWDLRWNLRWDLRWEHEDLLSFWASGPSSSSNIEAFGRTPASGSNGTGNIWQVCLPHLGSSHPE